MFFEEKTDTNRSLEAFTDYPDTVDFQSKYGHDNIYNIVMVSLDRGQVSELVRGLTQWLNGEEKDEE